MASLASNKMSWRATIRVCEDARERRAATTSHTIMPRCYLRAHAEELIPADNIRKRVEDAARTLDKFLQTVRIKVELRLGRLQRRLLSKTWFAPLLLHSCDDG